MHDNYGQGSERNANGGLTPRPDRARSDSARRSASENRRAREGGSYSGSGRGFERTGSTAEERAAGRPIAHPSSRGGGRPTHSGRIPQQNSGRVPRQGSGRIPQQGRSQHYSPSPNAQTRPRRTSDAPSGRSREEHPAPGQTPYQDRDRYLRISQKPERKGRRVAGVLVSLGVVAAVVLGVVLFVQSLPANITLNGASIEVHGGKTLADALSASGIKPQPGDLLAVDGSVLEAGKGKPFYATVNGAVVEELDKKLASGDVVEIGNGGPIEEPSDAVEETIPWTAVKEGTGAIHVMEGEGKDGVKATKTGKTSGIKAEQVTQEPSDMVCRNVTPNVGDDKVIALTFDDGPWGKQTGEVLDVLAANDAKATFFTVGNRIERDDGASFVKRAVSEGHQVCTHSYDHASGSGQSVNLGYMTPQEQVDEIKKGYAAIEAATGTEASRIVRVPGGNFGEDVVKNIGPLIKAEIGWNIDSNDWRRPGPQAIVDELMGAWPGAIVLMHDGGGDRSQTIEALKTALPRLKEQGYRFITIDELMQYPLS
ncbi:polysaccharide deacetylase family protein [Gordonibacter massiliensis]|nr:polysaccharide deacetylase family protein [Gordonibacter massiliensis (ex Traore et al. 2017)]